MCAIPVSPQRNLIVLVLLLAWTCGLSAFTPRVETKFGTIQGIWSRTSRGRPIANYLGIPYALPPVADLRFRNPEPWNRTWDKPYDGTRDGPMCIQQTIYGDLRGKEDCLYLNIFVPVISGKRDAIGKLPVMVFVHGGAFNTGSSNSKIYSPEYLLDQKLILVTVNYRLNVLGFFSTANRVSPGNYGVKDVLMALRWVQENIGHFQGDPDSVTLAGQSAGAAIVHLLALSNKTEGLFHRYILQSGSALAAWAVHPPGHIRKTSLEMARLLGCLPPEQNSEDQVETSTIADGDYLIDYGSDLIDNENFTEDQDEKMMTCLRKAKTKWMMRISDFYRVWELNPYCVFGPTIEEESEDAVITVHPMTAIKNHLFRDIPWIVGTVEHEGLVKSLNFFTEVTTESEMIRHFETYLPYLTEYHERISNTTVFADAIEDFYFGGNVTAKLLQNITEVIGDAIILWPTYQALKYQSKEMNSSTYFFRFSYEGTFTSTFYSGIPIHYGVAHMDDLNYIFPILNNMYSDQMLHNTENDLTMINIMTEMWSSFVADGVPKAWRIPDWPNYRDSHEYLRIGLDTSPDVTVENEFLPERMAFWEDLMGNISDNLADIDLIRGTLMPYDTYDTGAGNDVKKSLACLLLLIAVNFF